MTALAQLDSGFTWGGFGANLAIELLSAFAGALGAFLAAWWLFRRQRSEERAELEQTLAHERDQLQKSLAHDRELFQENIAYDRKMRRDEDRERRKEREQADEAERRRILEGLLTECRLNKDAVGLMSADEAHQFPLRHQVLDQALELLGVLPEELSNNMQRLSLYIDRYNAINTDRYNSRFRLSTLMQVNEPLVNTLLTLEATVDGDAG